MDLFFLKFSFKNLKSHKIFTDTPDPPQSVEITKFDRFSVNLAWKSPKSDGGAPVLHYIIERRLKREGASATWVKATPFPIMHPDTRATALNLETGFEYEFRVTAVNDAGPGLPSKLVGPHLVRDPVCKLYFCMILRILMLFIFIITFSSLVFYL